MKNKNPQLIHNSARENYSRNIRYNQNMFISQKRQSLDLCLHDFFSFSGRINDVTKAYLFQCYPVYWKIAPAIARSCFGSKKMADSCFQDRSHRNTIVFRYPAKVDILRVQ